MKRLTVIPWLLWALFIVGFLWMVKANAEPLVRATEGGVVVTIYTEKCALPAVANLAHRATWTENGKTTEGCAGPHPLGLIVMYFTDKTVVIHPMQAFVSVTGV